MLPYNPLKLTIPTHTDEDIKKFPSILIDLKMWNSLSTAVESSTFDPTASAEELDRLFKSYFSDNSLSSQAVESCGGYLWEFWEMFAQAASQVPFEHPGQDRLVRVIHALRDIPHPVLLPLDVYDMGGPLKLWSDLPDLESVFSDAPYRDAGINLEVFIIRLTVAGLMTGFEWLGRYALSGALEFQPESRSVAYDKRGELLDNCLPRAALWIQLAGPALFHKVCLAEEERASHASCELREEHSGFSRQRWNRWKIRLLDICGYAWPSRKAKDLAWDTMNYMNYIDEGIQP